MFTKCMHVTKLALTGQCVKRNCQGPNARGDEIRRPCRGQQACEMCSVLCPLLCTPTYLWLLLMLHGSASCLQGASQHQLPTVLNKCLATYK